MVLYPIYRETVLHRIRRSDQSCIIAFNDSLELALRNTSPLYSTCDSLLIAASLIDNGRLGTLSFFFQWTHSFLENFCSKKKKKKKKNVSIDTFVWVVKYIGHKPQNFCMSFVCQTGDHQLCSELCSSDRKRAYLLIVAGCFLGY